MTLMTQTHAPLPQSTQTPHAGHPPLQRTRTAAHLLRGALNMRIPPLPGSWQSCCVYVPASAYVHVCCVPTPCPGHLFRQSAADLMIGGHRWLYNCSSGEGNLEEWRHWRPQEWHQQLWLTASSNSVPSAAAGAAAAVAVRVIVAVVVVQRRGHTHSLTHTFPCSAHLETPNHLQICDSV